MCKHSIMRFPKVPLSLFCVCHPLLYMGPALNCCLYTQWDFMGKTYFAFSRGCYLATAPDLRMQTGFQLPSQCWDPNLIGYVHIWHDFNSHNSHDLPLDSSVPNNPIYWFLSCRITGTSTKEVPHCTIIFSILTLPMWLLFPWVLALFWGLI